MTHCFRAQRVLTMNAEQPTIQDAGILVQDGIIQALGPWETISGQAEGSDLGAVTLVPGLINAHTHLELSHLAGRIGPGLGFAAWADALFACLREEGIADKTLAAAVAQLAQLGTCFVADVVGRHGLDVRQTLMAQGLDGHVFSEFSGRGPRTFAPRIGPGFWSLGVHALYSTQADFAQKVKKWCVARSLPFSLHLAEVPGENELFQTGTGALAEFLRQRRILPQGFQASGRSAVAFAHELGLLDAQTLAVHCVQADAADVAILAGSGAHVCLCPRSNAWIGVGQAPMAALWAAGVPLCLGTDSLASNADLDLWAELRVVRTALPQADIFNLLALVTRNPAQALGIDSTYGTLAVGRPAVWAVLPPDFAEN